MRAGRGLTAHWLLTDCSLLRARIEYSDQSVCREESLRSANLDSEAQTQIQSTSRIDTKNVSIEQHATFFSLATGQTLYPLIGCSWHRHGHLNLLTLLVSGALSLHWQSDSGTPGHWSVSMEIISGWHIPAIVNYEPDSRAYYCSNYAAISDEWSGLTVTASRSGRQLLLITEQTVEWEQWGSERGQVLATLSGHGVSDINCRLWQLSSFQKSVLLRLWTGCPFCSEQSEAGSRPSVEISFHKLTDKKPCLELMVCHWLVALNNFLENDPGFKALFLT